MKAISDAWAKKRYFVKLARDKNEALPSRLGVGVESEWSISDGCCSVPYGTVCIARRTGIRLRVVEE